MLSGAGTLELDLQAMALGVADFLDKKRSIRIRLERRSAMRWPGSARRSGSATWRSTTS